MKNTEKSIRKIMFVIACALAATLFVQLPAEAASSVSCKDLYDAAKGKCESGVKKVTEKSRCSLLTYSYRKNAKDFYFAADGSQVYCICIVKADSTAHAKEIKKEFVNVKKAKKNDNYLKADEKKIVKNARCGRSGSYVWYICMGSSSDNKNAEKALKKAI